LQIKLAASSLEKISPACRGNSSASANRRFEFQKRGQQFIGMHNVTLSVAVRVDNPFATRHPRLNTRVLRQDIVQEISRVCEMAIFKIFRY
jgi:hypothetical protein